jgi:hypothetical protein
MQKMKMFQLNVAKRRRKKAPHFRAGLLHLFNAWQFPTLAWGDPTLPSALRRFTSEFGMGSGGTTALKPPGKFCLRAARKAAQNIRYRLKIVSLKNASGVVRLSLTGH